MKKILALLLAGLMAVALCACGGQDQQETPPPDDQANTEITADSIDDNMTSEDGKYEIAFVTDVGSLKDKSFNQGTWNGVKLYAYQNELSYKYYQPANGSEATDNDRYDAMKAAVENGAKVVVCAGFMQTEALKQAASQYPDVDFIFIDGTPVSTDDGTVLTNVAAIAFQEEQAGYLAGYAAVMDGYTKLGFCGGGGGENPACCRYGYGFVQGADAAAAAKDIQVEINYSWQYGASFGASPELQTMASGWYTNGTEVIFACGGTMFESIAAAASANEAAVIGVDVDQSYQSDTVITSALKGVGEAASWAVGKAYDGSWADIGGVATALGAKDDAVGLPVDTWSLTGWTVEEYQTLFQSIVDGTLTIDSDYANLDSTDHVTLNII